MNETHCEQLRYAYFLGLGANIGLLLVTAAFVLYVGEVFEPHVPLERLPMLWGMSAAEFAARSGLPTGWAWVQFVHRADMLNVVGITVLALASVPSLLAVIPLFARRREPIMPWVCALQIAVIVLAASGVLASRH